MDFFSDLMLIVKDNLDSENIQYDPALISDDPKNVFMQYLDYRNRRISNVPRIVHYSAEILASDEFSEYKDKVENLERIATIGGNLSPFQTRQLYNLDFTDPLLNDWNIQHLHLGDHLDEELFCSGTSSLIYGFFNETDAYFIAIMDHHSFSELNLLEIMDNNWPTIIDKHVAHYIVDVQYHYNSQEIHQLRKAGVLGIVRLNSGKVLMPMGGGYSTAHTSIKSMQDSIFYSNLIAAAEKFVSDNKKYVIDNIGTNDLNLIHLIYIDSKRFVLSSSSSKEELIVEFNSTV